MSLAVPVAFTLAQESVDLGLQSSGLLPTNPFYFLKEWGREFRKLVSTSAIKKAELEFNVASEKAAEVQKLTEISPDDLSAIVKAIVNYNNSLDQLVKRLKAISQSDSADAEKLAENIASLGLRQYQLLENLSGDLMYNDKKVRAVIDDSVAKLVSLFGSVPGHLVDWDVFRSIVLNVTGNQKDAFRELRAAEIFERMLDIASGPDRDAISAIKDDILLKLSGRLEGFVINGRGAGNLESLPGDNLLRVRILDELRERVLNSELRNELNILRQRILEKISSENGIREEEADAAIRSAEDLLAGIEIKIAEREGKLKNSVKELIERAKFNLSQAGKFFAEENYGSAFGQATASSAALKSAWNQLAPSAGDNQKELEVVKKSYDELSGKALAAGLTKDGNPKLFSLLGEAERRIVELSKAIETKAASESIAASLRVAKMLIATIEEVLEGALNPQPFVAPSADDAATGMEMKAAPATFEGQSIKQTSILQSGSATVVIFKDGFSPKNLKIQKGTKVTWINDDLGPHWPAAVSSSGDNALPGFDALEGLSQGETYVFVFDKIGVWRYRDNLNPGFGGVIEVTE